MKILINMGASDCSEDTNFSVKAEFESNDDTTAYGAVHMLYQALKTEGYAESSIIQALYDVAIEQGNENNYIVKEEVIIDG